MKINEPEIPYDEYRSRWRKAYHIIEQSYVRDILCLSAGRQPGINSLSVLDTLLAGVRSCRPGPALLLLESIASGCTSGPPTDCSLIDSPFYFTGGILKNINRTYMPEHWLSEFLLEHCGLFHSENDIELCQLPTGSYYIYCDHPLTAGKNLPVHLGVCQVFSTPEELSDTLSISSADDLNNLTGEKLVLLYATGGMSMNTYLAGEEKVINLVFRKEGTCTYITDQETDAEYVTEEGPEDPYEFMAVTHSYSLGIMPSNVQRLRVRH